jgi:hypothetical protein
LKRNYDRTLTSIIIIIDRFETVYFFLSLQLITPCEDLLKVCHWKGVRVNCSDIFYMRLTFEGYCCAFNYVKNTSEWRMRRDKIRGPGRVGRTQWMSIVIVCTPRIRRTWRSERSLGAGKQRPGGLLLHLCTLRRPQRLYLTPVCPPSLDYFSRCTFSSPPTTPTSPAVT